MYILFNLDLLLKKEQINRKSQACEKSVNFYRNLRVLISSRFLFPFKFETLSLDSRTENLLITDR